MSINCIANTEDQCIDVVDPSEFILSTWTDTAAAAAEIHHYNTSAVVPLKCHANENSFFGAEGLCSSDWQGWMCVIMTWCLCVLCRFLWNPSDW